MFAGFVARMGEERLLLVVVLVELVGGNGYVRGHEKDWMVRLDEDKTEFGVTFKGWQKAAQKAGRWL